MIILNFSYPLSAEQVAQIEALAGEPVERIVDVPVAFAPDQPFAGQVAALADACGLTAEEWYAASLLVVPPSLNFIAVTLLAELHGRTGYFPACVRLRPVAGALLPRYEVAEILALNAVREAARVRRWGE